MPANTSSTFSSLLLFHCMNIDIVFNVIRIILLLPLSIIILYLGFQKWWQQHSFKTASHSDLFTYHLAAMEMIWVPGWFCVLCAHHVTVAALRTVGKSLITINFHGQILFHVLTCVERYLAVVHPVIFMRLKNTRGVRIRNVTIGCVWVLCFVLTTISCTDGNTLIAVFCLLAISICVTCYCSISVLCVLLRPGPGDGGREKERVDQSKQRAFHTITVISVALWLWFAGTLVNFAVSVSHSLNFGVTCLVATSLSFCNLPSYLVSPLLYLHRTGKLTSK